MPVPGVPFSISQFRVRTLYRLSPTINTEPRLPHPTVSAPLALAEIASELPPAAEAQANSAGEDVQIAGVIAALGVQESVKRVKGWDEDAEVMASLAEERLSGVVEVSKDGALDFGGEGEE